MNRMKGTQAQSQCLAQVPLVKVMKKTMDVTLKPMNNQMNKHELKHPVWRQTMQWREVSLNSLLTVRQALHY